MLTIWLVFKKNKVSQLGNRNKFYILQGAFNMLKSFNYMIKHHDAIWASIRNRVNCWPSCEINFALFKLRQFYCWVILNSEFSLMQHSFKIILLCNKKHPFPNLIWTIWTITEARRKRVVEEESYFPIKYQGEVFRQWTAGDSW